MHANVTLFRETFSRALEGKAKEMDVALTDLLARGFAEEQFLPPALFTCDQTVAIALGLAAEENEKWRVKRVTSPRSSWHPHRPRARRAA